jgi:hypothetical protein
MANIRGGCFSLDLVYKLKKADNWFALSDVWISPSPYIAPPPNSGYFVGGTPSNTTNKLNYASDATSTTPGVSLSLASGPSGLYYREYVSAISNSIAGYVGGGGSPADATRIVDKITYVSDSLNLVPTANLITSRIKHAAAGNSTAGYFGGGYTPGPGALTSMDKVTYSSETTVQVPGASLSSARYTHAATGNQTAGYFGGSAYGISIMDKLTYSTDTTVRVPGASLSSPRGGLAATGNSTAGYFGGGDPAPSPQVIIDKLTYSTDTTAAVPGANLSVGRYSLAATGNSTAGYFGGGVSPSAPQPFSTMDKLTYSTDTTVYTPSANLIIGRYAHAATSALGNALPTAPFLNSAPLVPAKRYSDNLYSSTKAGYFGGGADRSTMDKVTYASDTTTAVPGAVFTNHVVSRGATSSQTAGYFGGGNAVIGGYYQVIGKIDKLTYSTDTTAYITNLSSARYALAATGNSTAGYFGGGSLPGPFNPTTVLMDKVTYSTDTNVAAPTANLSSPRYGSGATGNSTAGYFGGGHSSVTAPDSSTGMDKLIYSTDTTAQVPGASLSSPRHKLSATGNSTNGYFGGGYRQATSGYTASMDKVTYSTDTTTFTPTAILSFARYDLAATGNTTHGYFGGGYANSSVAIMDKVNYSTDTTAYTPTANLSLPRYGVTATSATANALPTIDPPSPTPTPTIFPVQTTVSTPTPNTGYFGGGAPGPLATIDKIDFSTDTRTTPGTSLSAGRSRLAATGNSTAGYFGGGSPSVQMDKITYSTDSTLAVPSANLSSSRYALTATGNSNAGYFGGGGNAYATMDKVTYSNDTRTTVPGANLTIARRELAATGNQTAGYFGGGTPMGGATMDKLTYSSDTTVAVPSANLSATRYRLAATGNSTAGYFGGGEPLQSRMDKLTYSTDTTAFTPTASLTSTRRGHAATGNSTAGYFGGSQSPPAGIMDKVTYSTDTTVLVPGAALSGSRYLLAATGARANALPEALISYTYTPTPNIV